MKKQKVQFMDEIEFSSSECAKQLYQKESKRLKFKIICAFVSLLTPLVWVLVFAPIPIKLTGYSEFVDRIIEYFFMGLYVLGIVAAIVSNPVQIVKTTLKLTAFGWFIIPFIIADVIIAIVCACVSVMSLMVAPTLHCVVGIYQSYRNKKDAEIYCMMNNVEV